MQFFLIILISLFLTSCSEENDNNNVAIPTETDEDVVEDTGNSETHPNNSQDGKENSNSSTIINDNNSASDNNSATDKAKIQVPDKPTFKVDKNDIVLGNPDAQVVLIEYYSPTCPHCAYFNKAVLPELKKKYVTTNKIAYVIREFISNKQDLDAAILQRCANSTDSFLKFQSVILEQQDKWAGSNKYRDLLTNIGQIGGISAESYEKCLKDDKIAKLLLENTNFIVKSPNFIGTPAFFINGKQISEGYNLDILSKKIDEALEKTSPTEEI